MRGRKRPAGTYPTAPHRIPYPLFIGHLTTRSRVDVPDQAVDVYMEARLTTAGAALAEEDYWQVQAALVAQGRLIKGQGRGGSVRRAAVASSPEISGDGQAGEEDEGLILQAPIAPVAVSGAGAVPKSRAAPRARPAAGKATQIIAYRHPDQRKNNPEVGMVTPATDPEASKTRWAPPRPGPAIRTAARPAGGADRRRPRKRRRQADARSARRTQAAARPLPELGGQGRAHQLRGR